MDSTQTFVIRASVTRSIKCWGWIRVRVRLIVTGTRVRLIIGPRRSTVPLASPLTQNNSIMNLRSPQLQRLTRLTQQTRTLASATNNNQERLQKRAVVGSFLFRRHKDGTPRVALFRRSDKVSTYAHKYACISGGVEPEDASPLKAALRELHEETSLTPESLRYLCLGKPWSFVDRDVNYEWSIHPFAFHWKEGAREGLNLGWEHEGHAWFQPHEIKESETAAGVVESLRRVWPEGDLGKIPVLASYILGEATGAPSGGDARFDADGAFAVFRKTVASITTKDSVQWRRGARLAAWHVWNHSDESVKAPLLSRIVSGLELLEQILEPQNVGLAPEFEKLAAMALENVAPQSVGREGREKGVNGANGEDELRYLTDEADRFFSELWKEE